MVKTYRTSTVLPYSWLNVARTFFFRYPNPFSTHILTMDTISRSIRPDGSLYSRRLITKIGQIPKRFLQFLSSSSQLKAFVVEESVIDLRQQLIVTLTRNVGFTSRWMTVTEYNVYRVFGTDKDAKESSSSASAPAAVTQLSKEVVIESKLFYGLRNAMESYGFEKFKKNSSRANQGYLYVLENVFGKKTAPAATTTTDKEEDGGGEVEGSTQELVRNTVRTTMAAAATGPLQTDKTKLTPSSSSSSWDKCTCESEASDFKNCCSRFIIRCLAKFT